MIIPGDSPLTLKWAAEQCKLLSCILERHYNGHRVFQKELYYGIPNATV
jgi:hypothetical protein